jgi:hypothetical protein
MLGPKRPWQRQQDQNRFCARQQTGNITRAAPSTVMHCLLYNIFHFTGQESDQVLRYDGNEYASLIICSTASKENAYS